MWCQLSLSNPLSFSLKCIFRNHHLKYVRCLSIITKEQDILTVQLQFEQIKDKTLFFRRYHSKPKSLHFQKEKMELDTKTDKARMGSSLIVDMIKRVNRHSSNEGIETKNTSVTEMKSSLNNIKWDISALKHKRKIMLKTEKFEETPSEQLEESNEKYDSENGDFVEDIALDEPVSRKEKKKGQPVLKGTSDPSVPMTNIPCSGCGSILHCQDSGISGYMPSEKLKSLTQDELRIAVCQRCYLMQHYNMCLNVKVDEEELPKILSEVKKERALVLVVIDLFDIRNSIIDNLSKHIGRKRPLYIIGNKVDMIPKDETGYLERLKDVLLKECLNAGLLESEKYCKHICLVSAKTGYGIESLITKLMSDWKLEGNVYMIGSTNSGKSTLFNSLLQSDYCKANVRDAIQRATVSVWPGTTLSLLKFPIVNPTPWRLFKRIERLKKSQASHIEEERLRKLRLKMEGRSKNASLIGYVNLTDFRGANAKKKSGERRFEGFGTDMASYELKNDVLLPTFGRLHIEEKEERNIMKDNMFQMSRWFFDSPGVVNKKQLIHFLNQPELTKVLPKSLIKPRPFVLPPSHVMFVSGLGRVDYVQGDKSIVMTVHTSALLPVHIVRSEEAEGFYEENIGTDNFVVPSGDRDRLDSIPPLIGKEFYLTGIDLKTASADIQLSSLGWVSFCIPKDLLVTVKAYTPDGEGCYLREPALLPNAKAFRGPRIKGTKMYKLPKFIS